MGQFFASDVEQNAHEVDVLRSSFMHVNPSLLMGDMMVNCGPISSDGPYAEGLVFIFIRASCGCVFDNIIIPA